MIERVIFVIQEYMYDLFEPGRNWPKYEFSKRSYARWAASEILKRIQSNPNVSPLEIVEDYVRKTDAWAKMDHYDRNDGFIFYVAHDVATDVLDILRAMN